MEQFFVLNVFRILATFLIVTDLVLVIRANKRNEPGTGSFAVTGLAAALAGIGFLFSAGAVSYLGFSFGTSLNFISIDVMLLSLLSALMQFFFIKPTALQKRTGIALLTYVIIDSVLMLVNLFYEIAVTYVPVNNEFYPYRYEIKPLFYFHLGFTYLMLLLVVVLLCYKMSQVTKTYRKQIGYCLLGIFAVILANCIYHGSNGLIPDISILGYSIAFAFMYGSCFEYGRREMMQSLNEEILDNISQGVVLFDYEERLIMANRRSRELLNSIEFSGPMMMHELVRILKIENEITPKVETVTFQCNLGGIKNDAVRCDYRRMKDENGRVSGHLFAFTDVDLEMDLLTGFHNYESFRVFAEENGNLFPVPTVVAILDINNLSVINHAKSREEGDHCIRELADLMKQYIPEASYFVRGLDARLIAMCYRTGENVIRSRMLEIQKHFSEAFQYALGTYRGGSDSIITVIEDTRDVLLTRKLMDIDSNHSHMLTSLVSALEACDSDTEAHVKRTQKMGNLLGERLGFSDRQQSQLALLCILHDIGKIGIPLEILNKPGKLTAEEWNVLQSHVEKGYEIANSSKEYKDVAEMILHHHERWDGKGYPTGLSKEAIPLLSRVISVVDSYDAMTSVRPYKRRMTKAEAVEELKRCAGTQFDPYIASCFIELLGELEAEESAPEAKSIEEKQEKTEDPNLSESLREVSGQKAEEEKNVHLLVYSRYTLDESGRILSADDGFETITGYKTADLAEHPLYQLDLIPAEEKTDYLVRVGAELGSRGMAFLEHRLVKADGMVIYVFCYGRSYYDSASRSQRSEVLICDTTSSYSNRLLAEMEREKAGTKQKMWESLYRVDSLTMLLNHGAYRNDVELRLMRNTGRCMMLMMDVDNFKSFNDTYGHQKGDELLVLIGQTLRNALRAEDLASRMGGDEFSAALFFPLNCSDALIYHRAQELLDKLNMTLKRNEMPSCMSMGAAIAEKDSMKFQELYANADAALYCSKRLGKGRLCTQTDCGCSKTDEADA